MNEKAVELGMTHSHFVNPHGLDAEGHYTSPEDELIMSRALLDNPQLASIVALEGVDFPPAPDGTPRGGKATNQLLGTYPGMLGIKTGYTFDASLVLAAAAERDGRTLFAVVMGSKGVDGHFLDVEHLLDFGFERARIPTTVSTIDPEGPLAIAAKGEALTWLGLSDLLISPLPPAPVVTRLERTPEEPDWREALQWVGRLWKQLAAEIATDAA
jgi:D-alanyl-D-alanine carboxypeptidase